MAAFDKTTERALEQVQDISAASAADCEQISSKFETFLSSYNEVANTILESAKKLQKTVLTDLDRKQDRNDVIIGENLASIESLSTRISAETNLETASKCSIELSEKISSTLRTLDDHITSLKQRNLVVDEEFRNSVRNHKQTLHNFHLRLIRDKPGVVSNLEKALSDCSKDLAGALANATSDIDCHIKEQERKVAEKLANAAESVDSLDKALLKSSLEMQAAKDAEFLELTERYAKDERQLKARVANIDSELLLRSIQLTKDVAVMKETERQNRSQIRELKHSLKTLNEQAAEASSKTSTSSKGNSGIIRKDKAISSHQVEKDIRELESALANVSRSGQQKFENLKRMLQQELLDLKTGIAQGNY